MVGTVADALKRRGRGLLAGRHAGRAAVGQRRVDRGGRLRPDLAVDLETATLLEMGHGRVGRTAECAGACELIAEPGQRELKLPHEIALVADPQGLIAEQRREPGLRGVTG